MPLSDLTGMPEGPGSRRLLVIAAVFGAVGGAQMIGGSTAVRVTAGYDDPPEPLVDPAGALTDQPLPGGRRLLRGVLTDPDGRRELRLVDPVSNRSELIAEAGWNLPPAGASRGDELLVCFNVATGTEPPVRLVCRHRLSGSGGWGPAFDAVPAADAGWLKGVKATAAGWDIRYYRDDQGEITVPYWP